MKSKLGICQLLTSCFFFHCSFFFGRKEWGGGRGEGGGGGDGKRRGFLCRPLIITSSADGCDKNSADTFFVHMHSI